MSLEENMHDVNNSGNEDATEDVSMDETSSDEFTAEDESDYGRFDSIFAAALISTSRADLEFILKTQKPADMSDEEQPPARQVGILDETPGGSRYWIPDVIDKPVKGTIFESVQHAYQVYKEYAKKCGLEIKKGGQHNDIRFRGLKKAKTKYFYCVREGRKARKSNAKVASKSNAKEAEASISNAKEAKPNNEKKKRRRRASCHDNSQFLRSCRKLTFSQKTLIHQISNLNMGPVRVFKLMREIYGGFENIGATATDCINERRDMNISNLNMGPVRVFKLMREIYGGFENIGATATDCINERRDMNVFFGDNDAQMAVDKLMSKQEYLHDFTVRYKTDENDHLTGVFKLMREIYGGFENIGATATDCINERRDMNVFFGDNDAQMAVDKLMSKQEYLHDFTVRYKTDENDHLTGVFKLMREIYGGFENIGATATDCINERRDMNVFFGDNDAQMAVDKLMSKQEYLHDFTVRYKTDENDHLTGLF
ncbi:FAR1 DNA binding domain, Zinc finger, SWIM-type, MULE transposase domain, FHY3/FAR1 family [Artemisia annua]|uniref:FAR1 DNA binding domain, Zinc finger, SWIM-type, MULE transposase domain, FHY3/FAR1 family n=1 Tax=Artemisia annua TaxID=35608 RepID=A0A2U1LS34_ARTAN|nr:FAR1 DNA binding domain, Zinc finger, SWIM-type, MULE transposase domain, FHY3/FAR1 family [Artemisia annua]